MYLDVFGDFPKDPPYFGYNSAGQENPVYMDSNWPGIFRGLLFSKIWQYEALKPRKQSRAEGKKGARVPTP